MWGERARGSAPGPLGNQSRRVPPIAAMGPPLRYEDLGADSPRPLAQREGRYSGGSPPLRATGARAAPSLPLACLEIQSRRFRCRSMPAGHRTAPPLRYAGLGDTGLLLPHTFPRSRAGGSEARFAAASAPIAAVKDEWGARGRWGGERHTEAQRAWTAIRRRRIAGASRGNEPIFLAGENRRTFGAPRPGAPLRCDWGGSRVEPPLRAPPKSD